MGTANHRRHGTVIVYITLGVLVFAGFVSLAIDVSHVRLVKTQLQDAADAAARAAAHSLPNGVTAAQNAAVAVGSQNQADGSPVTINPNTDIDFGTWSNGTFTVLTGASQSSANAVRVRCYRTSAAGNAVSLTFARLIGFSTCDVNAQSTAKGTATLMAGFIGYAGITFKNNAYLGGYNSSVTTTPGPSSTDKRMRMGSNTSIVGDMNDQLYGDAVLGPGATISGVTVSGSTYYQSAALSMPTMPTWNPQANPGALPQNYTVSSDTTLPGGNYWFTSLTINANVSFSGPATLYVNGPIIIGGACSIGSGIPADLTIYQYGSNTFGDSSTNGMTITARVVAPGADFVAKNNLVFMGSGVFNTITTWNNASFYYDETEGAMDGTDSVSTVQ